MTNDELKRELDALGVAYKAKATHDELEALLAPFLTKEPTEGDQAEHAETETQDASDEAGDPEDATADETDDGTNGETDDGTDNADDTPAPESTALVVTAQRINVRLSPNGDILKIVEHGFETVSNGESVTEDGVLWQPVLVDGKACYIRADLVSEK